MESKPLIVGLGEVLWDVFQDSTRFGGAPANFACHASSLGGDVYMVSVVGEDQLGDDAIEALAEKRVHAGHVSRSTQPTGVVHVTLGDDGQPEYEIVDDVAWDHPQWNDDLETLAGKCDAVCFGTLGQRSPAGRELVMRFLDATPASCLRVFDVNLRQSFYTAKIIRQSLERANVLKLNADELPVVCEALGLDSTLPDVIHQIRELFNLNVVAITRGSDGSTLVNCAEIDFAPAVKTNVADTVGAGDAFTAALVIGLLRNRKLAEINAMASQVAAFVCSRSGATPEIPEQLQYSDSTASHEKLHSANGTDSNRRAPHFDAARQSARQNNAE